MREGPFSLPLEMSGLWNRVGRVDDDYDEDEYAPLGDEGFGAADQPGFEPMDGPGLFDVEPEPDAPEQSGPGIGL